MSYSTNVPVLFRKRHAFALLLVLLQNRQFWYHFVMENSQSNVHSVMFHLMSACRRQAVTTIISKKFAPTSRNGIVHHLLGASSYHAGSPVQGLDEFFDIKKPNEVVTTGRAWTVADVRRKSFDDIHKLWFVLYKECNLLLSEREKNRRNQRPVLAGEEHRYIKVKRSMAAIKQVLSERQRINDTLRKQGLSVGKKDDAQPQS